eukprot:126390_1
MENKQRKVLHKVIVLGDSGVGKTTVIRRYIEDRFRRPCYKSTIGCDFRYKEIVFTHEIDTVHIEQTVLLQMWDTCGQERFQSLGVAYYRGVDTALIIYDVTNRKSFKNVKYWLKQLNQQSNSNFNNKISIGIVANKIDMPQCRWKTTCEESSEFCNALLKDKYYEIKQTKTQLQKHLLCYGYIRTYENGNNMRIPMDIYNLCFKFYLFIEINSCIHSFKVSAKSGEGINEMFEQLTKVKTCIDYYEPVPMYVPPLIDVSYVDDENYKQYLNVKYIIVFIMVVIVAYFYFCC